MKLFHGSNQSIDNVDLSKCRAYKDFGRGFYLTDDYSRAVKIAEYKTELLNQGKAEVSMFNFLKGTATTKIKIKEFKTYNWEWAEFIMKNRDRRKIPPHCHNYDVVIGPVADSQVDEVIARYRERFGESYLEKENLQLLAKDLEYGNKKYIQFCFCTPESLNYLFKE